MQRGGSEAVAKALTPQSQTFNIGSLVSVTFDWPQGAVDPAAIEDAVADLRAAYQRALERQWAQFHKAAAS